MLIDNVKQVVLWRINYLQMKYFIFLLCAIVVSCNTEQLKKDLSKTNFVYIKASKFQLKGADFFPIMLNYVPAFRKAGNDYVLSPVKEYENPDKYETNTKDSIQHQLKGHLQLIKEMGFNSIRLCFNRVNKDGTKYFYYADSDKLYLEKDSSKIITALQGFVDLAAGCDLRVMLLIAAPVDEETENFTIKLLKHFQNNPSVFSYDFFNEPLYFDNADLPGDKQAREKKDAYKIVCKWKNLMTENAPNQLFTIGFSEPIEVFEWDPSIMPVDFVAFHTYHPLRVPNEIYWYSKYVNKPWMIGETALPANNDSITYNEQRQFMKEVYGRIIDCGGAGLGWWEFQEIPYTHFEAQYTGLLTHTGVTTTKDGKYTIQGTVKPAIKEIAKFKERKAKNNCNCMDNYYNMVGYTNIVLNGKIVNKDNGNPIEGAVIRGWNEWWSVGQNTFSNKKGEFTLYSNDVCMHFEISAPGMTKVKFDYKANYKPIAQTSVTLTTLPNQYLEYHKISYKPFLLNNILPDSGSDAPFLFNFDKSKFGNALFQGQMKEVELSKLEL